MKNFIIVLLCILCITQITNAQWFIRNSGTTTNFKDVNYIDPYFLTIVGENGAILRSTNSGFNWIFQPSGTPENLNSVDFLDVSFGFIVGSNGTILKTTSGGINWEQLNSGTTEILYCVSCFDYDNCIAVGTGGTILKTSDSGNTWTSIQSGTIKNLLGVSFTDVNNVIIVGLQTILKSTNGGVDWISNTIGSNYLLRGISCVDSNNCFAVGTGIILYTSDGGNTWEDRTSGTTHNLSGVSYNNLNYCNSVGSIGTIIGTTNAGLDWMFQPSWTIQNLLGVSFVNPDSGIAVGNSGVIRMTYTAGIPVELINFTALTKDGVVELSWETATEINNHIFEIEKRREDQEFYTIGYMEGAGTTTEPQKYSFFDRNVEQGTHYYRLKQIDFNGVFEYSKEVEVLATGILSFSLSQNYPNPFNPVTSIQYEVSSKQFVLLIVYDLLGNEIATLVNEEKQSGTYEVEFNINSHSGEVRNLSSGVYFYQLRAADFVENKKMILLK
jgi:photosystem II stability/assembly factor-like uncharacterized protein